MRNTTLVLAFAAFGPLAAAADPIAYDFVTFRFTGTVTSVEALDDDDYVNNFRPGDQWNGAMRVFFGLAPMDSSPAPTIGTYVGGHFIPGRAPGPRGTDADRVELRDGVDGIDSFDGTSSYAWYQLLDGQEYRTTVEHSVRIESSVFDFIQGDALMQAFAISGDGIGEGVYRASHRPTDAGDPVLGGMLKFVVNAFSARPGSCRAT